MRDTQGYARVRRVSRKLEEANGRRGHVCANVGFPVGFPNPRNTLLIAPRASQRTERLELHRSPPVPSSSPLYSPAPGTALRYSLSPSTFSLAALGMANTPPCRGYVSRMRPPPPAAIHPTHPLFPPPRYPRSMSCSPSCQPVWPPTHTTFSSFPPLTSPPYSSTTLSTFPSPPLSLPPQPPPPPPPPPLPPSLQLQRFNLLLFRQLFSPLFLLLPLPCLYIFLLSLAFRLTVHVAFAFGAPTLLFTRFRFLVIVITFLLRTP